MTPIDPGLTGPEPSRIQTHAGHHHLGLLARPRDPCSRGSLTSVSEQFNSWSAGWRDALTALAAWDAWGAFGWPHMRIHTL